ncbi:MAG: acylphosphatase [Granulosicoccus sp.]|nr:acylphosphatase [Granulosicoccus sp.]
MISGITRHHRISGRVQGVGFRYSTRRAAEQLDLSGWVRNRPDDTEETSAGHAASLNAFEQWLRQGPPGARVNQVTCTAVGNQGAAEPELRSTGLEMR